MSDNSDTPRMTHAEVAEATREYLDRYEQERRENPTGDSHDHHKLGYGWHGPSVDECPECGTSTVRRNRYGNFVQVGYVCPECRPLRKRLLRGLKRLVP